MPSRIIIEFMHGSSLRRWTNRYYCTDAWTAGGATMDALVDAHKGILRADSIITKVRIDDNVANSNNYDTVAYNAAGTVAAATTTLLPLYDVARCDFDVAGGGSPSRKYLRGLLREEDVTFGEVDATIVTALNTYGDAVVAIGSICDPQGNLFVDAVPWPYRQHRQMGRRSKKRVTP